MRQGLTLFTLCSTLVLNACTHEVTKSTYPSKLSCIETHTECTNLCSKDHLYNSYKHEKCNNLCERYYHTCLEASSPVIVEHMPPVTPVIVEYPHIKWVCCELGRLYDL